LAAWLQKQQRQTIARRHPVEGGWVGTTQGLDRCSSHRGRGSWANLIVVQSGIGD